MMLPKRNSATPSMACNAVGDSILVRLGQRNINVERKGGRTNRWKGVLKAAVAVSELIASPLL
jgi:hypothetical protein